MKKLILAAIALTTAAGVFAQGTVVFNNRISGSTVNQTGHVWGPGTPPGLTLVGLGSNDSPAGTTDFAGNGMQLIGAGGRNVQYGYATTFAQLLAANGGNVLGALTPASGVTTFRSGTSLGDVAAITATLNGVPLDSPLATLQIVAWDNLSGLYPTWAEAEPAWLLGTIAAGMSARFNVANIGGALNTTPVLTSGLTAGQSIEGLSFNLYFIPEPSTFALAGLGAAALLIFRRRK